MNWLKKHGLMLGLIVALAGVGGYSIYRAAAGPKDDFSNKVRYVCIETGKVFSFPRGETRIPPLVNPDTKRATLLPCTVTDDAVSVSDRYRGALREPELAALNKVVDLETMKVRAKP